MRIHSFMHYRSESETWNDPWKDRHYRPRNLVKALKQKPFNGFSDFKANNGKVFRVENTPAGHTVALAFASAVLATKIGEAGYQTATVVPIPASNHTAPGANFTGGVLAGEIQKKRPGLVASSTLYFDTALQPSAAGGGRNSHVIQQNLRGGEQLIGCSNVILLDDVYTSGAHLRGTARYLASLGVEVADGFVLARTAWDELDNMFVCAIEEIGICD